MSSKGGDEEKFKLIVEAHQVLSNPQSRQRYDMGEDDEPGVGMGGMGGMDFADLFAHFHAQSSYGGGGFGGGGFSSSSFGGGYGGGHGSSRSGGGGGYHNQPQGFPF